MRTALRDPSLLGKALPGASWARWRTMLIAANGEPLTRDERTAFETVTGGKKPPSAPVDEAAFIIGRRGGKDRAASVLAVYIAACCEHPALAPGERGVVLLIAADTRQAAVTLQYIAAAFDASPVLGKLVVGRTADTLSLANNIEVEVRSASFRRLRGMTAVAAIGSEVAFWPSDSGSANPDVEILNAIRPALATTGGPIVLISSPYARRGALWDTYRRDFGPEGDPHTLVVQGSSRTFNPTLPQAVVDRALERDTAAGRAEYLAEFRTDIEGFVTREAVDAVVPVGLLERPPVAGVQYSAFVDPSGGSADSMTLAIAHREGDMAFLDAVREARPPFSPEAVVSEFARLCDRYGVRRVVGDRYAGEWPRERFRNHGIDYDPSPKVKNDIYIDFLPLLNSRQVGLLDHDRLVPQLIGLERRIARSGRDSIDHAPGSHDDIANAVAGALVAVSVVTDEEAYTRALLDPRTLGEGPLKWTPPGRRLPFG